MVPVEAGVWLGERGSATVAFYDYKKAGITILLEKGGRSWSAIGYEALVAQPDRRGLIHLNALEQSVKILEEVPQSAHYFDNVKSYKGSFYIDSPYNPLWIYQPETCNWTGIELDYVRDSDFAHLGTCYYTPSMSNFVLGREGEIWGFQGTKDGNRGNAVCHYLPEQEKWEHFEFPWETCRGDDHWPIGITDKSVWFSSSRDRILLFNKETHRWNKLEVDLPARKTSPLTFCDSGLFVACQNRLFEFQEASSSWESVELTGLTEDITAIGEKDGTLYLAYRSGLYIFEDYREKSASEPLLLNLQALPECKCYDLVLTREVDPKMAHVDKLCEAVKCGDKDEVQSLIQMGLNLSATTDRRGYMPIHLAAEAGHIDIVQLLLEAGVDVNARTTYGWTPLKIAVQNKHIEMADYLISKGGVRQ